MELLGGKSYENGIDFSVKEMQALMFMIEDDLCREEG